MTTITTYEQDVVKWSEEQAQFLLTRQFDKLDLEHLADEVLDVGKSEIRELESRMIVLLTHLIKWQYQPTHRGRSWTLTIAEQRKTIKRLLKKMPSLKSKMHNPDEEFWEHVWFIGRTTAAKETGLDFDSFPADLVWLEEDILDDHWLPETK